MRSKPNPELEDLITALNAMFEQLGNYVDPLDVEMVAARK